MLKVWLSSRTKQRLIMAARAADLHERESAYFIENEAEGLLNPGVPMVELATGLFSIIGQRVMKKPSAFIAGAEEFFRKK